MSKELVPVTQFSEPNEAACLNWNFPLPPSLDAERILINVSRLEKVQWMAGIATSSVYAYQGDRSEFTPGIAGVNADGSALATKAGVNKPAETHDTRKKDLFNHDLPSNYGKVEGLHQLNKAEIASRVSDRIGQGATQEQAWAKELDASFRESLRDVSKAHLIDRKSRFGQLYDLGILSYSTAEISHRPGFIGFYVGLHCLCATVDSLRNRDNYGKSFLRQRRLSINPYDDYQPDRFAVAAATLALPGMIKVTK